MVETRFDWMPAVGTQCWQVTALIAVVWLINRTFARNRPHLASVLWLVVLIKCVTPPVWSSPSSVFSWLQSRPAAIQSTGLPTEQPVVDHSSDVEPGQSSVTVQIIRPKPQVHSLPYQPDAADRSATGWFSWVKLLVTAWLVGVLSFTGITLLRWWICWRRMRRAGQVLAPEVVGLTNKLRRQLGLRFPVRVVVSRSPVGPAVVGLFRPTIILPALIVEAKAAADLEPLLAHELVHIRRGDLWIGALQLLAQSVWWFHPLVRLVNRLLTRDAERCCDEEVIARLGCDPARYARTLIDVLELKRTLQIVPAVPGVRPVDVTSQRLERIMKLGQGCHKRTPRYCWAVMLLAGLVTLPGAALIVASDEPAPLSAPAPPAELKRSVTVRVRDIAVEQLADVNSTSVYDLRDLVEQCQKDMGQNEKQARAMLENLLMTATRRGRSREESAKDPDKGPKTGLDITAGESMLVWADDNRLIVRSPSDGHAGIHAELQSLRKNGFQQLIIQTQLLSGPAANPATLPVDWKVLDLAGGQASTGFGPADLPDVTADSSQNQIAVQGRVETIIEKRQPTMLAIAEAKLIDEIINSAQAQPRTNVLAAPQIRLFNGDTATVQDILRRPFVTGINRRDGQNSPVVQVYEEGWSMHCRPRLQADNKSARLDLNLTLRAIVNVETKTVSSDGNASQTQVQVPELSTTTVRTTVNVPLNQSLIIGGLTRQSPDAKSREPFLVLVRVSKVEPHKTSGDNSVASPGTAQPVGPAPATVPIVRQAVLQAEASVPPEQAARDKQTRELIEVYGSLLRIGHTDEAKVIEKEVLKVDHSELTRLLLARAATSATRNGLGIEVLPAAGYKSSIPEAGQPPLLTRVYPVADLVVRMESDVTIDPNEQTEKNKPAQDSPPAVEPNFEPLTKHLREGIDPNSWDVNGGSAGIHEFKPTLSLIIRQTEANHRQIQQLLKQMRSFQDLQLSLAVTHVQVKLSELEQWDGRLTDAQDLVKALNSRQRVMALSTGTEKLLRTAKGVTLSQMPKVTVFNGQRLGITPIRLGSGKQPRVQMIRTLPVMSADFQRVRLDVSAVGDPGSSSFAGLPLLPSQLVTVPDGGSLLVDLTEESWRTPAGDVLATIPYVSRLFQKAEPPPPPKERYFYLITPRILIVRETEEESVSPPANSIP